MQQSKHTLDKKTANLTLNIFNQLIADTKTPQESSNLLSGILTNIELTTISKRICIAYFLKEGKSYEDIKKQLKVSSATIATVQNKLLESKGMNLAIKKITADQWASKWAKKITSFFS